MQNKTLTLVRGLPGSAKTTLARDLAPHANFAADDYFTDKEGVYHFDASKIRAAHEYCQRRTRIAMQGEEKVIAVHNTFSKKWEAQPYFRLAEEFGYSVFVVECQNDFGNTHGVPKEAIKRMKDRWEPLRGELTPLRDIFRVRFWEWYYDRKRKVKRLFGG